MVWMNGIIIVTVFFCTIFIKIKESKKKSQVKYFHITQLFSCGLFHNFTKSKPIHSISKLVIMQKILAENLEKKAK